MGLVTSVIPNLVNGVSQQARTQRLASQAELQINMVSSLADGLKRRPPSRHRAQLSSADWSDAFLHTIDRDPSERYAVAIAAGDLKVFDLDGVERTVAFPDGKAYLNASSPSRAFRAVTVADYTFLINVEKSVALAADTTPERPAEALVNVRQGNYGRTYKIAIDGVTRASVTTPDGAVASDARDIDTGVIANGLANQLAAAGLPDVTVTRLQSAVHISKSTGDFAIAVEDGFNGAAMKVAKKTLQRFSDLPAEGPDGFQVEIVGDPTSAFDNYHVRFEKSASDDSAGVWRETAAPGIPYAFDAQTMPHVLTRDADGGFTFQEGDWSDRDVGDENSAPSPSFVGRTLNDVFFFRGRLGVLADENVVLSRAGDAFNFWPKTATALVDSDPVDLAATTSQVSILRHAAALGRSLVVFSDQTQFTLDARNALTPSSGALTPSTAFGASLDAAPVTSGRHVYFAVPKGGYEGLREYALGDPEFGDDAADVAKHVPRYVPAGVFKLAAAPDEDMIVALTRGAPEKIFVYSYYWSGAEKLQSSWSEWSLGEGAQVLSAEFIASKLMLVVARAGGVFLEEIDIDAAAAEPGSGSGGAGPRWLACMDRKLDESQVTVTYDPAADRSEISLPYAEAAPLWVVTAPGDPAVMAGRALPHDRPSDASVALAGDWRGAPLRIGRRYESRYRFSPFVLREAAPGGGAVALDEGRLQILYLRLTYAESGPFAVEVTPSARRSFRYPVTGRVIGSGANLLGDVALESGRFRAPVYAENDAVSIDLVTDSFLPCAFTGASWEGARTQRGRRR